MAEGSQTTERLVSLCRQGDDAAFSLLVERMMPMLRGEASLMRCNRADADDLAQEALLALHAAAMHYRDDGGASFMTYARVCVRRRLQSAALALLSPETPHEDDRLFDEMERDACAVIDPGEWLLHREEDAAYIDSLKTLLSTLEFRVLMCHLSAYSYEEIASLLGISPKAVDNALQRVRRKLSQHCD